MGGVRLIAIGCTLRRLVAKCASNCKPMCSLLAPYQLGFWVRFGAEAVAHSARSYLHNLKPGNVILKLDFFNAFDAIRRDKMLSTVESWL